MGWGAGRTGLELGRARVPEDQTPCPTILSAHLLALSPLLLEIGTGIALQTGYSKGWTGVPQYCPTLRGQSSSSHKVDPVAREGSRGTARQQESFGHTSDLLVCPLATGATDSDQGE